MQLFALNSERRYVSAMRAQKQTNYLCPECGGSVRLRGGQHRQNHFYHLEAPPHCRQHAKTFEHLQLQNHLLELLPQGECSLEHRFDNIGRIADVAWHPQKLIFEIQCSPMSAQEVMARNRDYSAVGFTVVWILHCDRYNRQRLTSMEQSLQGWPHYFGTVDHHGRVSIFDQFAIIRSNMRLHSQSKLAVELHKPHFATEIDFSLSPMLACVRCRLKSAKVYFSGDLADLTLNLSPPCAYIQNALALEQQYGSPERHPLPKTAGLYAIKAIGQKIAHIYRLWLQILLERACK